jgi:hypothetical protein
MKWIQANKLRLIGQSIDQKSISQADVDQERWQVRRVDQRCAACILTIVPGHTKTWRMS